MLEGLWLADAAERLSTQEGNGDAEGAADKKKKRKKPATPGKAPAPAEAASPMEVDEEQPRPAAAAAAAPAVAVAAKKGASAAKGTPASLLAARLVRAAPAWLTSKSPQSPPGNRCSDLELLFNTPWNSALSCELKEFTWRYSSNTSFPPAQGVDQAVTTTPGRSAKQQAQLRDSDGGDDVKPANLTPLFDVAGAGGDGEEARTPKAKARATL